MNWMRVNDHSPSRPVEGVKFVNQLLDIIWALEDARLQGEAEWQAALVRESKTARELHSYLGKHPRLIKLMGVVAFWPLDVTAFLHDGTLRLLDPEE